MQDTDETREQLLLKITTLRQRVAELEARHESEKKYRALIEQSIQGIAIVQESPLRILFANQACADLAGCTIAELLSLTPTQATALLHPEDREGLLLRLQKLLVADPAPPSGELRICRPDGIVRWIEYFANLIEHEGQPAVMVTLTDITQRKQAEETSRRLQEFNESIIHNMTEGIVMQDAEGCFTFVNPAAAASLGFEVEELIGQHWTRIVPVDQHKIIQAADERRARGESGRYQVELVTQNGQRLSTLVSGSPLFDTDTGLFDGSLAVFTDITSRVQTEQQLTHHAQEMAALYETSLEINAQPNLSTLLRAIVQRASVLLGVHMGGLYLIQPGEKELELVVGYNLAQDLVGTRLQMGEGLSGRVAQAGEPIMVDDYWQWPGKAEVYAHYPFRRVLGVPLKVGERVIGVINVNDVEQPGSFDEEEIRLVSLFADQAAIAVENARLFQETQQQLRDLALLFEASTAISTSLAIDQVLHTTARQITSVLEVEGCTIYQWERDRDILVSRLDYSPDPDWWQPKPPGTIHDLEEYPAAHQVLLSHRTCVIQASDPEADPAELIGMQDEGVESLLMVPLIVRDEAIGLLDVKNIRKERRFTRSEISLCQTMANYAASALENARLFQAEHEQRELAEALRKATAAVSSTLDLDQVLDQILEQMSQVVPSDSANIMLIESDTAYSVRWYGYDHPDDEARIRSAAFVVADTPNLRQMQETGQALVVPDTSVYVGWARPSRQVLSYAAAPITVRGEVIGYLNINKRTRNFFTQGHADRLQAFADQVGLAISNAQLFQNVEAAKQEWEASFDAMHDAVVLVDSDHRIVRVNLAFANLMQKGFLELVGQDYHAVQSGITCPEVDCRLDRAFRTGRQAYCVHQKGERVYEVLITPVSEDKAEALSRIARAIYVMRDVTEARQAAEEIQRRNRELALLNRIIAASAASQDIESILGTVCRELALLFQVPQSAAALFNEEQTEAIVVAEYLDKGRSKALGEIIPAVGNLSSQYLLEHKAPLVVENVQTDPRFASIHDLMHRRGTVSMLILPLIVGGEVVGTLGVDAIAPRHFSQEEVDLAQRAADQVSGALARVRLAETQRRLSVAVEQADEAVIITNTDGRILYANPAFERITGVPLVQLFGQSPDQSRTEDQIGTPHDQIWDVIAAGQAWQGRLSGDKPNGTHYIVDATVTPVRDDTGEIVNYVGTIRDVTREIELEEQFHQAQKMEALGRLAGGIAHDFNNVLTVVHLSTRILQEQVHPQDPRWEHIERIREAGDRASSLTRQLLSFSRQEIIEPRTLDLNQIVADLNRMLERLIGENITMNMNLAEDLWSLRADPIRMDQVIMNLVINARDAMPEGGTLTIETANVTLGERYAASEVDVEPGDYIQLTVSDTGIGMAQETMSHLFEPFFTTKERSQGTGLGLSTVFGIVKQVKGHIRVQSLVGEGTTFRIYLPRIEQAEAQQPATEPGPLVAGLVHGTEKVLVVEDETAVRELAVSVLNSCGYQVLEAVDGPEALRIGEEQEYTIDLLVTDVIMPHMSGRELAEKLKAQRPDMHVLYMSGYAGQEITEDGALAPWASFLPKPFTVQELAVKVRMVLDGR